jgi:poly-gamma-glutamate capsule biosynthesis protein CapA/YwtB (metallophosphatase superfamily)
MKEVNITNIKEKLELDRLSYLVAVIFALLGTLISLYFSEKDLAIGAFKSIFTQTSTEVIYDTYSIYLDSINEQDSSDLRSGLEGIQFEEKKRFEFIYEREKANFLIQYGIGEDSIRTNYLLPVGHMYWISDSVSSSELLEGEYTVLLEEDLYEKYGTELERKNYKANFEKVSSLEDSLRNEDCNCIGLVEPQNLSKEYKLLRYDDKYYLDTFDCGIEVSLLLSNRSNYINTDFVKNIITKNVEFSDGRLDEDTVAKVNMTGVTAMGRRVIQMMNSKQDYEYPAKKIAEFLSDADLTHTSNEVSFVDGCSVYSGLRFCSRPEAIAALKLIGVDLIELTGNHNNDFGSQYNTETIELYKEEGIEYFGGGLNSEDAAKPYITEIDGTKIGFLGYNYYDAIVAGGSNALAGSNKAGANPYSESRMKEDIGSLREEVDIVIVDFQFQECYSYPSSDVIYPVCYKPINNQANTFRKAIDYGADIIVGTQAHQPQTYELYGDGLIFYGLGNLFFDQNRWIGTRQGIVLTHYFYNGKLLQTKLTPTIYDADLQVEVAEPKDAQLLLELLSTARKSL